MGWHRIKVWECQLRDAEQREKTLASLAFTLNHIYLQDHAAKRYELLDEVEEMPMAAEDA